MADFVRVGGFDESVFLFCEERIISRKISDIGKKIGIVINAKYNHNHSASISKEYKSVEKQIKLLYKSRYYYNCKYNKISLLKKVVMLVAMRISLIEFYCIDIIRKIKMEKKNEK